MKIKFLFIAILLLPLFLTGCAGEKHIIGYDITEPPLLQDLGNIYIAHFSDQRPVEEKEGVTTQAISFSSKDGHFSKDVPLAIEEILASELNNYGFCVVGEKENSDYQIFGSVKHFQAITTPAKATFLPYVGGLVGPWVKDEFTILLSVYIKMEDQKGDVLIDKAFDVSGDLELSPGLLSLARYKRGFNYKLKLLDEALKDVMERIREEIIFQISNR